MPREGLSEDPVALAFRVRLRLEMFERGLTPTTMGRAVGVSSTAVRNYLKGERAPMLPYAHRIAAVLGLSLDEMCTTVRVEIHSATVETGQASQRFRHLLDEFGGRP